MPTRGQLRSSNLSHHRVLVRPLGLRPIGVEQSTYLTDLCCASLGQSKEWGRPTVGRLDIGSDRHDKPFYTKAITIIDNFKKALGDTIIDKSQFFKAISVIDKLSPINFSDECCDKFLIILTKFFCKSHCKNVFLDFSNESSSWTLPWH